MSDPLVWLPFDAERLADERGRVPEGLRFEKQHPHHGIPDSAAEVTFYVPPYQSGSAAVTAELFAATTSLQVVQTLTAGVEHVRAGLPDGITLCNARGVHDASTAELALALTLASLRDLPAFVRDQDRHEWDQRQRPALADKRVLILGYGSIGQAIERRLEPFETEVVRVARTPRTDVHGFEELPDLLPEADVVILIAPLTEQTAGLVDAEFLARLKDDALLVNVARGGLVDHTALRAELGRIAAALDVTDPEPLPADDPLWDAPRLLISPHVGGATDAMWPRAYRLVREQLRRFAAGEELANVMTGEY